MGFSEKCLKCGGEVVEESVLYTCPLIHILKCSGCGHEVGREGEGIQILSLEEGIKKRPEMYLNCGDSALEEKARKIMEKENE